MIYQWFWIISFLLSRCSCQIDNELVGGDDEEKIPDGRRCPPIVISASLSTSDCESLLVAGCTKAELEAQARCMTSKFQMFLQTRQYYAITSGLAASCRVRAKVAWPACSDGKTCCFQEVGLADFLMGCDGWKATWIDQRPWAVTIKPDGDVMVSMVLVEDKQDARRVTQITLTWSLENKVPYLRQHRSGHCTLKLTSLSSRDYSCGLCNLPPCSECT